MNNSETHQLFHVPELVSVVCEHVSRIADLNSLAMTSKRFFHEPALNGLWRDVPDLATLVRCFPSSLWEEKKEDGENGCITLKRGIKLSDWDRFDFYAKRVRSLAIAPMMDQKYDRVDGSVYSALDASCFGQCLFPNLRSFALWLSSDPQGFSLPMLNMFLNPSLEVLVFSMPFYKGQPGQATTFLHHLHKRCPKINSFGIEDHEELDSSEAVGSLINQWSNLKKLTLSHAPTPEALQHLARLDSLKVLIVTASDADGVDCLSIQAEETSFSNLELLEIESGPNYCREFLKATVNSPLRDISLEIDTDEKPCGDENRKSLLGFAQAHRGLERLRIWEEHGSRTPSMPPTRMEDIEGVLTLSRLKHFVLRLEGGTDLDDNNIREIARAFPDLEVLRLGLVGGDIPMDNPSTLNLDLNPCHVTLAGVSSLVELCPNLETMNLRFDARNVPDGPPNHISNGLISVLHVDDCPISLASVPRVAEYFFKLLPSLEDIDFEDDVDDIRLWIDQEIIGNWRLVGNLLKEMHNLT